MKILALDLGKFKTMCCFYSMIPRRANTPFSWPQPSGIISKPCSKSTRAISSSWRLAVPQDGSVTWPISVVTKQWSVPRMRMSGSGPTSNARPTKTTRSSWHACQPWGNSKLSTCHHRYIVSSGHWSSIARRSTTASTLQHTLPPKFQRIRSYGWMSPNSRTTAEEVRWAVLLYLGLTFWLLAQQRPVSQQQPAFRCAECGGPVKTVAVTDGIGQVLHGTLGPCTYHNGLGYRDSG